MSDPHRPRVLGYAALGACVALAIGYAALAIGLPCLACVVALLGAG